MTHFLGCGLEGQWCRDQDRTISAIVIENRSREQGAIPNTQVAAVAAQYAYDFLAWKGR